MSENLLDNFLALASSSNDQKPKPTPPKHLKEIEIFSKESNIIPDTTLHNGAKKASNLLHTGDTDSSDDEDNKYHEEQNYNESGRNIKHLLKSSSTPSTFSPKPDVTWKTKPNQQLAIKQPQAVTRQDVYADPIFGLHIINPQVSFTTLQERMVGREPIMFSAVKKFVSGNISDKNWVLGGIIVGKSSVKTSQKGNQFLIWTLSDLKFDMKTVAVFLFGGAYKQLWKTPTGTVVGILNPSVFEKSNKSKDEATLSVDNAQKVMILGQSKDLGTCRSMKKNGERCTAIVNISQCEFCVYHIKQEYQKCSKRSELQANFAGRGLTALRNKVLGKNEVFYAGKSYTAIPAKRSRKLQEKDNSTLQALSGGGFNTAIKINSKMGRKKNVIKSAANIEITLRQRSKDLALLDKLGGDFGIGAKTTFGASHSSEATLESSKRVVSDVLAKLQENDKSNGVKNNDSNLKKNVSASNLAVMDFPVLSGDNSGVIDLGAKVTPKHMNRAKLNALKYIQRNGPLKKSNPNSIKKLEGEKRALEISENPEENPSKKQKIENEFLSDRFKKIMEASSKHTDLLDVKDNEEQEKYFYKLEAKEKMEEKMINTYKMACKAVRCLKCKYTNFSASQFCKDNKHPLKVFDAMKRFFKCGNCGNRTQTLEIIPTVACQNCGSGKWERTGMMKEKTVGVNHALSIRGGEQTFVNSVVTNANLDLMVPED